MSCSGLPASPASLPLPLRPCRRRQHAPCAASPSPPAASSPCSRIMAEAVLSARNQLPGVVASVKSDAVMSEVVVTLEGSTHQVVSIITTDSVKRLGLKPGSKVNVVIKSTSVMLHGVPGSA
ncbi:hypothetical protein ABPG75_012723 [Micractinium tetrahymenae]